MAVKRSKALATSAGLSILFLIVYGGCNWFAARRGHAGAFYFQWERNIPFVPLLILPYMSIDIFFIAAPFLCKNERELSIFTKRVATAILVAGAFFLLFPLRFSFPRPHASGWTGALFDWFRGMDAPYNLFPSLHATFWLLLVSLYGRRVRGVLLWAVMIWFAFIGLSPVLTYQHHVIDILGGFALAGYCFYFFRETCPKLPVVPNARIGFYYAAGAAIYLSLVPTVWPWSALFLWPFIALCIASSAYFGVGPIVFRKQAGRLPWSTRLVLGPCLFGQHLSLFYYRRQCRLWDEITPCVWIGGRLGRRSARNAVQAGVTAVLDLSAEFSETKSFRALCYRNIPILDLTAPTQQQLREMAEFIAEQCQFGVVYVHCKIGYSRSAAAVAAYLMMTANLDGVEEALAIIRRARPSIVIRSEVLSALSHFARELQHSFCRYESLSSLETVTLHNNRAAGL
jgi:protein-tyrosine phosphatase/membrane-associated phospholipid phosphatase